MGPAHGNPGRVAGAPYRPDNVDNNDDLQKKGDGRTFVDGNSANVSRGNTTSHSTAHNSNLKAIKIKQGDVTASVKSNKMKEFVIGQAAASVSDDGKESLSPEFNRSAPLRRPFRGHSSMADGNYTSSSSSDIDSDIDDNVDDILEAMALYDIAFSEKESVSVTQGRDDTASSIGSSSPKLSQSSSSKMSRKNAAKKNSISSPANAGSGDAAASTASSTSKSQGKGDVASSIGSSSPKLSQSSSSKMSRRNAAKNSAKKNSISSPANAGSGDAAASTVPSTSKSRGKGDVASSVGSSSPELPQSSSSEIGRTSVPKKGILKSPNSKGSAAVGGNKGKKVHFYDKVNVLTFEKPSFENPSKTRRERIMESLKFFRR